MGAMQRVVLVDAGTGNLRSVSGSLREAGAQVTVSSNAGDLRAAGRVVMPGVGAFGNFMAGLRRNGLDEAIFDFVRQDRPLLGICVGMQALLELSEEMGCHAGLGLLPGRVMRFPGGPGLKIPQTGWNQLWVERENPLLQEIHDGSYAYFNHSYYCAVSDAACQVAATDYGMRYTSVVAMGNVFGVQFHPEKSQQVGLQILANFLKV